MEVRVMINEKRLMNPDMVKRAKRRNLQTFTFGFFAFGFADACIMIVIIPLYLELTGSEFITGILITFLTTHFREPTKYHYFLKMTSSVLKNTRHL